MDDGLVVWLDGGGMVKNDNFCFKIVQGTRGYGLVEHDHAFSEACALESVFLDHAFDGEADCLTSVSFLDG